MFPVTLSPWNLLWKNFRSVIFCWTSDIPLFRPRVTQYVSLRRWWQEHLTWNLYFWTWMWICVDTFLDVNICRSMSALSDQILLASELITPYIIIHTSRILLETTVLFWGALEIFCKSMVFFLFGYLRMLLRRNLDRRCFSFKSTNTLFQKVNNF